MSNTSRKRRRQIDRRRHRMANRHRSRGRLFFGHPLFVSEKMRGRYELRPGQLPIFHTSSQRMGKTITAEQMERHAVSKGWAVHRMPSATIIADPNQPKGRIDVYGANGSHVSMMVAEDDAHLAAVMREANARTRDPETRARFLREYYGEFPPRRPSS